MKKIVSIALVLLLIVTMIPMAAFASESKATDIVDVTGKTTVTLGGVEYKVIKTAAEITDPAGNYYLPSEKVTGLLSGLWVTKSPCNRSRPP